MDHRQIERISKALADETRLKIYEAIAANDGIICGELVDRQGVTAATISHHMKVLSDAGLIECRKEGQFVRSHAVAATVEAYAAALNRILRKKRKSAR
jgi:ArsR family transcriptional regulator